MGDLRPLRRIKAYKAPEQRTWDQPFKHNKDSWTLRHTLSTDVKGLVGPHAGLHVLGDNLLAVNGEGTTARVGACLLYMWERALRALWGSIPGCTCLGSGQ